MKGRTARRQNIWRYLNRLHRMRNTGIVITPCIQREYNREVKDWYRRNA